VSGTRDDSAIDLDALRQARSSTPDAERKHCPHCGGVSLSPRGTSIHGQIDEPYHCETCGRHTEAREDRAGGGGDRS
jgi:hypothetical protein